MPAVHILAANKINADTAGKTHAPVPREETPGAVVPATFAEIFHGEMNFGSMLSGGTHPEHVPAVVNTATETATDSVKGRLGGLIPKARGVVAPGPAGGGNTAKAILGGYPAKLAEAIRKRTS